MALSDLAETCIERVALAEFDRLVDRLGMPTVAEGEGAGKPCGFVVLGLGKLGARELTYRSVVTLLPAGQSKNPSTNSSGLSWKFTYISS